jgi:hypothetical protein
MQGPIQQSTFRWHSLLTKLGIKGTTIPEMDFSYQPVMVIGDGSQLTPQMRAPQAWYGRYYIVGAGNYWGMTVRPKSDGGCVVEHISLHTAGASPLWQFRIEEGASSIGFLSSVTVPAQKMTADAPNVEVLQGDHALGFLADAPVMTVAGYNAQFMYYMGVWIPSGSVWSVITNTVGVNTVSSAISIREIPEGGGAE